MQLRLRLCVIYPWPQKHFPPATKVLVDEMVKNIREEFLRMLDQTDWMDPKVRILNKDTVLFCC
jgi:predicted metalloendopeptidase